MFYLISFVAHGSQLYLAFCIDFSTDTNIASNWDIVSLRLQPQFQERKVEEELPEQKKKNGVQLEKKEIGGIFRPSSSAQENAFSVFFFYLYIDVLEEHILKRLTAFLLGLAS